MSMASASSTLPSQLVSPFLPPDTGAVVVVVTGLAVVVVALVVVVVVALVVVVVA